MHEDQLVDLEIDGSVVRTTEHHPFWNASDQEWQRADELDQGDQVLTSGGNLIAIDGVDPETVTPGTAYNLTVGDIQTFFVGIGDEEVLVHNVCKAPENLKAFPDGRQWKVHVGE